LLGVDGNSEKERKEMSKIAVSCAVVFLTIALTRAASAQAANPEPGFCAQFYPNEDCNSDGPPTPAAKTTEASEPAPALTPAPTPAVHKHKRRAQAAAPVKQQ
jgi:hypothetical protein